MTIKLQQEDLISLLRKLYSKLNLVPSRSMLARNEFLNSLISAADHLSGYENIMQDIVLESSQLSPPISELVATSQIAYDGQINNQKSLEISCPGSSSSPRLFLTAQEINKKYLSSGQRLKTLYVCPNRLIPVAMSEARKYLPSYNSVCITQENRRSDLEKAKHPDTDIIFMGFKLASQLNTVDPNNDLQEIFDSHRQINQEFSNRELALDALEKLVSSKSFTAKKNLSYFELLLEIQSAKNQKKESRIIEYLHDQVFTSSQPSYIIINQAQALPHPSNEVFNPLYDLFINSQWGVVQTHNYQDYKNLGKVMYLLGQVQHPDSWRDLVKNNSDWAKEAIMRYRVNPCFYDLGKKDPAVPYPNIQTLEYEPAPEVLEAYSLLMQYDDMSQKNKHDFVNLLLAHPQAVAPNRFDPEREKHRQIHQFFEDYPGLEEELSQTSSNRATRLRVLIEEIKSRGEKSIIFTERDIFDLLENEFSSLGFEVIHPSSSIQLDEYGLCDRYLDIIGAALNPDCHGLIASRNLFAAGIPIPEFTNIINYMETTSPLKEAEANSCCLRNGQRKPVNIYSLNPKNISFIKAQIKFRKWKGDETYQTTNSKGLVDFL